jgi:microcystin-dependent protein
MDADLLGSLLLLPYHFVPEDLDACEGQKASTSSSLYGLLGNQFGPHGGGTFSLPDLRDKAPLDGLFYGIITRGTLPE